MFCLLQCSPNVGTTYVTRNLYANVNARRHMFILLRERAETAKEYYTKRVHLELWFKSCEVLLFFLFQKDSTSHNYIRES